MASTRSKTTQEPPVVLPIGYTAWLLDCAPVRDCERCQSEWQRLNKARDNDDVTQAARHATQIRDHASGVH
jgi:hypothetical protein